MQRKAIYLLPNFFTTLTIFGGFYAIVMAINGHFATSAAAVFGAMIADSLDGRIARMMNSQSEFGKQYDSLADLIGFGIAPALTVYLWALQDLKNVAEILGKAGWLVAFIYTCCAALRLARFNIHEPGPAEKGFFIGLPSPAAAAIVMSFVWFGEEVLMNLQLSDPYLASDIRSAVPYIALLLTLFTALLMVSTIKYNSFKNLGTKVVVPFSMMIAVVLCLAALMIDPATTLFAFFLLFWLSGPIRWGLSKIRKPKSLPLP